MTLQQQKTYVCIYTYIIYIYIYIYIYTYIRIILAQSYFAVCSLASSSYLLAAVPTCYQRCLPVFAPPFSFLLQARFELVPPIMADRKDSMECTECGVEQVVPVPVNNPHVVRYCVRMLPSRCTACCTCLYHMCQRDGCNNRNCDECLLHRIVVSTYGFLYGHIVNYHYL